MADLRTLDEELFAVLAELERLNAQATFDPKELSNLRYRIARAIAVRRKPLDALFAAVIARGGPDAELASAARERSMEVRARYTAHIGTWSPAAVAADWPGYCVAAAALRAAIRDQVEAQKPILYPWLALAP